MERPTGSVNFLFTDVEGSTKLLRRLGDRYADALADHFSILRDALAAHGGVEQGTEGDSLFAVFPSATGAVRAAVESQRALGEHDWPNSDPIRVRMGLHSGEATVGHDGYVGLDVHRAARISSVAHGGQIVASSSTVALSEQALPDDIGFTDLGAHRLKDLSLPEHLSQVVAHGLEADFPPLRSLDAVPNNLPIQLTHFIGRDTELAEALGKLDESRLLKLTGVGGTGKTRLALQAAAAAIHDFPDGVWMVDLAPVSEADMVDNALAATMGVRDQPGRTLLEVVEDALRNKTTLIILDNCEHLHEISAQVSAALLQASSNVKILATSREALGIAGEATYPVPSLSVPPASATTADEVKHYDSAVMFENRARLARPDFAVTDANAETIAKICRRLDAVQPAIELAAARVRVLSRPRSPTASTTGSAFSREEIAPRCRVSKRSKQPWRGAMSISPRRSASCSGASRCSPEARSPRYRWCAAGMLAAEKQFRRVKGHRQMPALVAQLRRHAESVTSARNTEINEVAA